MRGEGQRGCLSRIGRVHAMISKEAQVTIDFVTDIFSIFSGDARVLFGPKDTNFFISCKHVVRIRINLVLLECGLDIFTPTGKALWPS